VAVKEVNPVLGKKGIPDEERCQFCKERDKGKPYEEFFTDAERAQFDAIAIDYPSFVDMLPPKDALYSAVTSTKSRREAWHDKKNKKPKTPGEFHHPHQLQCGGCPLHQDVVPVDETNAIQVAVDEQITDIVKAAVARG
jgi:hypothetical protein